MLRAVIIASLAYLSACATLLGIEEREFSGDTDDAGSSDSGVAPDGEASDAAPLVRYVLDFADGEGLMSSTPLTIGLSSSLTIEYWFRVNGTGSLMSILHIENGGGRSISMEIGTAGEVGCTLTNQASETSTVNSPVQLNTGAWNHIACTYDGLSQRIFINGTISASGSFSGELQLNDNVTISGFASRFLDASIDEFRLSGDARYTSNFTPSPNFASDADTLVLWTFDEGIGEISADLSGNNYSAALGFGDNVLKAPSWSLSSRQ